MKCRPCSPLRTMSGALEVTLLLDDREGLDHVVFLDVLVVGDLDPTLETFLHLADVILVPLEGADVPGVDHPPLADQSDPVRSRHGAVGDPAAGDVADLGGAE